MMNKKVTGQADPLFYFFYFFISEIFNSKSLETQDLNITSFCIFLMI